MRDPALKAAVDRKSELRSVHASACRLRLIVYRQPIHSLATSLHADQVPDVLQRHLYIGLVSMAMRLLRILCILLTFAGTSVVCSPVAYCTVSLTVLVCCSDPLVAVTVNA